MYTPLVSFIITTSTLIGRVVAAACTLPPEPHVLYVPPTASPQASVHRLANISDYGVENLAVRSNGQILVTAAFGPMAGLWHVDPLSTESPVLLLKLPGFTSTLGITELAHDMFYFAADNSSQANSGVIFSVDMRPFVAHSNGTICTPPIFKRVGAVQSAGLNGITHIRNKNDFILIADTALGGVWKTDVHTGESNLIIKDPTMKGPPNTTAIAAFGINGIRMHNDTLFYSNSGAQTLHRMRLHTNGLPAGAAHLIASNVSCDDFTIDSWGVIYVASPSNALLRIDPRTGDQLVIAGTFNSSSSSIIGASSVQFGRGTSDKSSVYVTTNGGSFVCAPPGSQGVSRIDIADFLQITGH